MYLNRDLGRERQVASQPVAKIAIDLEPCMTMLLEKLRKSDQSLEDCCLCLEHIFKDQPWLLRVSEETRLAGRNSQVHRWNVPSVNLYSYRGYTNSNNLGTEWITEHEGDPPPNPDGLDPPSKL